MIMDNEFKALEEIKYGSCSVITTAELAEFVTKASVFEKVWILQIDILRLKT